MKIRLMKLTPKGMIRAYIDVETTGEAGLSIYKDKTRVLQYQTFKTFREAAEYFCEFLTECGATITPEFVNRLFI